MRQYTPSPSNKIYPDYTMNILSAHLNTSSATEMYLTILELADIGGQNVVLVISLSSEFQPCSSSKG